MAYLHENKEEFANAVNLASEYFRVLPIIVEKDYYVLLYLRVEHRYQNVIKQSSVFQKILILQLIPSYHKGK